MKKIPIVLLAGFLGSGKTTLLNAILTQQSSQKIAVIVNDFGSVNIDAGLVAKQADEKIELTNGCICCETGEDGIGEVLDGIAHEGSMIDAIVVECSGLADPMDTMRIFNRIRNEYCYFDSSVYVVDASQYHALIDKHPDMKRHVSDADVVLVNKVDIIDDTLKARVLDDIAAANPRAMVVPTEYAKLDTRLLFGGMNERTERDAPKVDECASDGTCDHVHTHQLYRQTTFETDEDLDPKKVFDLLENPPKGVYRMKGMVQFGMKGMGRQFSMQFVAGRHELRVLPNDRWATPTTEIVVIGDTYDDMAVTARLANLVDDGSEPPSADTMLDIFMFE